jgi:hypothetical protein
MTKLLARVLPWLATTIMAGSAVALTQDKDPAAIAPSGDSQGTPGQNPPQEGPKTQGQQPPGGQASPIEPRGNFTDQQGPAPRPGNQTLDPAYVGFLQIPNTPLMIKFNAKPRVDITIDTRNAGDDNRFVTALIPVDTSPSFGGGTQFNINAKGSQLSVDVRAPTVDGSPRFYYENDFFGAGAGEFPYRIRQLYGEIYNLVVGMTYSVFEDPDVWPDTVDYEGPNAMIFARRPLARYLLPLNDVWELNFGLEQPDSQVDTSNDPNATSVNHAPDVGVNIRWEDAGVGHVQVAVILRELGVRGPIDGTQESFGWGVNWSNVFTVVGKDSVQFQLTYGLGIFRYSNDDFFNNDAAFNRHGEMKSIPYFGAVLGYTHFWSEEWRSTVTGGLVHLVNQFSQQPTAYHETHYVSANIVWQIRKRLSIGLETLYGSNEDKAGNTGNVERVQIGVLYSLN